MSIMKDFYEQYYDKVGLLEKENEELCEDNTRLGNNLDVANDEIQLLRNTLHSIREICNKYFSLKYQVSCVPPLAEIENKIDEVLNG